MNGFDSDSQWQALLGLWRQQPVQTVVPTAILHWVRRQERRMRLVMLSEWLFGIAVGFHAITTILAKDRPDNTLWLVFVLSMLALAMGFSLVNRRGLWAPLEESARAYVDLALLRLRRKRREVHFCWLFLLIQTVIILGWHLASLYGESPAPLIHDPHKAMLILLGLMGFMVIYSLYIYRRTAREKAALERLQDKYSNSL
ncbi:hypothetical protein [Microbulbifer spongiae]|uniref:Uncharacterized protein n=1 Tax=Microbulbifer spongiae TaxID=2944933 RepID=A0ABY9E998_9GAMM|nr:hypothetical protein [Microbulbifer sp. MI-G]WKD49588.1 hypothetical protein M8T91_17125 [Microbulbifer sp. MI-G]